MTSILTLVTVLQIETTAPVAPALDPIIEPTKTIGVDNNRAHIKYPRIDVDFFHWTTVMEETNCVLKF